MGPRRIGILGFDGVAALDLVGPTEAFFATEVEREDREPSRGYEVLTVGLGDEPFTSESGLAFRPNVSLRTAPPLDTIIVPGGAGLRVSETTARVSAWLEERAASTRRVASVCTGIYGLAPTGLLDGRRVTTHWRFARDVARRFPRLKVEPDSLFIRSGRFYTSAGITAAIDLALALIEEDHGPSVALTVARELVVYLKRPGGQEQYSEPLRFQAEATGGFADLAAWMAGHLQQDLTVDALAERACLCPRHFSRRFKEAFGSTPAAFVEELRLDEARRRLAAHDHTVEAVAASVGYKSADAFRRAFERRFGINPSAYRVRFGAHTDEARLG